MGRGCPTFLFQVFGELPDHKDGDISVEYLKMKVSQRKSR